MPNVPTSDNPLEWAIGEQNAAAKEAGMTLEEWQAQYAKPASEPDMRFNTAGPDVALADEESSD